MGILEGTDLSIFARRHFIDLGSALDDPLSLSLDMDPASIDGLLERYLVLLDEYTSLRSALGTLQSSMYHSITRANFSAERGLRYGPDHYDDRMQALRRVRVTSSDTGLVSFAVAQQADIVEPDEGGSGDDTAHPRAGDPLQWFGILTPGSLRHAQSQAIQAVQDVIPRLASVDAEMASIEIQVRRARKKRAKAEAAEKKEQQHGHAEISPNELTT